ncbi:Probable calcium-binding protein CML41 [Linum perenne]
MATAAAVNSPTKRSSNKGFRISLPILRSFHSKSLNSSPASSPAAQHQSPPPKSAVAKKEEEMRRVFRYFDSDGDGKISGEELGMYFSSMTGDAMSREDAEKVIMDFDGNGDGLLEFGDFVRLVEGDDAKEIDGDLKRAFHMFEEDKGDGCITPRGLQRMLNRLGDRKSLDECSAMIRPFDLDGNGVLDFQEFQNMMN